MTNNYIASNGRTTYIITTESELLKLAYECQSSHRESTGHCLDDKIVDWVNARYDCCQKRADVISDLEMALIKRDPIDFIDSFGGDWAIKSIDGTDGIVQHQCDCACDCKDCDCCDGNCECALGHCDDCEIKFTIYVRGRNYHDTIKKRYLN